MVRYLSIVTDKRCLDTDLKFVAELIKRAVCLGRAPGFRRKDVDFAFNAAMIRAY